MTHVHPSHDGPVAAPGLLQMLRAAEAQLLEELPCPPLVLRVPEGKTVHLEGARVEVAGTVVEYPVPTPKFEEPREALSYNDVEILRALADGNFVYGNLASICETTGLARELVSQRLTVMKAMGVIETRINEKNVLHWFVSARGKGLLADILSGQEQKKIT